MMNESTSDGALVARAVEGDRAAFAALVSRHYETMFRVAWKSCGNREDAEDIAQDVCILLGKSIHSFAGNSGFSTWLYRVVLNATRDHQRKLASEVRKRDSWAAEPTRQDFQPANDEPEQDRASEMWNAVRQLPPKQRDTLLLVFGEGVSHAQAAQVMDCAEGTIASNIHDAKKRLKDLMRLETSIVREARAQ